MANDNRDIFNYRLARSRTRETSTLTVAIVAASASLVLLVLYVQASIQVDTQSKAMLLAKYQSTIVISGFLFAALGIAYREITVNTIHKEDEDWLRQYLGLNERCGITREIVILTMLLIPIIAWSTILILSAV